MKLKDILDNTDAPIFVRASLINSIPTQKAQMSQSVGLLSETVFANDVVFDHNISYPEYYRPYRECSVDVITVDNYITDKITESNIPYLDVTIFLYFSHEVLGEEGSYTVSSESVAEAVSSKITSNLDLKGDILHYTGAPCSNCGRGRVELYANGEQRCDDCYWNLTKGEYEPFELIDTNDAKNLHNQ